MNDLRTLRSICAETVPAKLVVLSPRYNENKATRVYVIKKNENSCKVGISSNPRRRLRDLQVSNSDSLSLFFECRPSEVKARSVEAMTLNLLKPWTSRGEWLDCSPILAKIVIEAIVAGNRQIEDYARILWPVIAATRDWESKGDSRASINPRHHKAKHDLAEAAEEAAYDVLLEVSKPLHDFRYFHEQIDPFFFCQL